MIQAELTARGSKAPPNQVKLAVAHVHTHLVGSGGDTVSELQARYLASRGHKVTMVAPAALDFAQRLAAHGIGILDDPVETRSPDALLARSGHFDIVHCHCNVSAPFAAELAQRSGAALVLHSHSMGEQWWECTGAISRLRPARRRLRRVIDQAVGAADRIFCVSEAVCEHMRKLHLPTDRAMILPNPINDVYFRDRIATGEPYDVVILARPSRAKSPLKALRILAAASRMRPGLRAIWIGRLGNWGPIMRNYVKSLRLRGLTFAGDLPPSQVCDMLDVSRVLLSASNREGQPLSVLEGLSRRCSALLSDIPAHLPFARYPGVVLFPASDVEQAAQQLVHLLDDQSRPLRPDLAGHTLEAHGRKLLSVYEELVRERAQLD
jgi:glycosyltransferase involved in cell wall biosynthesis